MAALAVPASDDLKQGAAPLRALLLSSLSTVLKEPPPGGAQAYGTGGGGTL